MSEALPPNADLTSVGWCTTTLESLAAGNFILSLECAIETTSQRLIGRTRHGCALPTATSAPSAPRAR